MKKKIIQDVKFWQYEAEIFFTDGTKVSFEWKPDYDVSENEIVEWMTEQDIEPESIEMYAYKFPEMFNLESLRVDTCSEE